MVHFLLRCMIFGAIFEFSNAFIPQIPARHHRHIHLQPIFATSWSKIITKGRSDSFKIVLAGIALLSQYPGVALAADASPPQSAPTIFVDTAPPKITDTCWIDLNRVGTDEKERVEIGLFGEVAPRMTENFKLLSAGAYGYGYKGSDVFRVTPGFSVQLGNIPQDPTKESPPALRSREGKAALDEGSTTSFEPESFAISHIARGGGIVSMMTDIKKKGAVDSRFFVSLADDASWADNKYPAFGRVIKNMDYLSNQIQVLDTKPPGNYPLTRVRVVDSGCY